MQLTFVVYAFLFGDKLSGRKQDNELSVLMSVWLLIVIPVKLIFSSDIGGYKFGKKHDYILLKANQKKGLFQANASEKLT